MIGQRCVVIGLVILFAVISVTSCAPVVPVIPPTATLVPSLTPTDVPTPSPSATPSPVPTAIPTNTPTATPTRTLVPSATPTAIVKRTLSDVACPTQNAQARQMYNDAVSLEAQELLEQAKASYQAAIELDANYCDAMDNLARLLRREGKLDQAIALLERSVSVAPNNVTAYLNLGLYFRLQGKVDDALAAYRRAIEIDPDNPEGYFGLGSVYLELRRPDDAIAQLQKAQDRYAATKSPLIVDTHYHLGVAHFTARRFGKAREYFELAYAQMADNPTLNYYLGMSYLSAEVNNRELAAKYLARAEELGVTIPVEVKALLQNATATPTGATTPTLAPATPVTSRLPLPTGQPVFTWNEIPIMPQAISGNGDQSTYTYTVRQTVQEVIDFYNREMARAGWQPFATSSGSTTATIVMYQKQGKTTSILVAVQGELVVVMLVQT